VNLTRLERSTVGQNAPSNASELVSERNGEDVVMQATDVGNIAFLVSDPSKTPDQAREAAIADARRKAEVYAQASSLQLRRVEWITEDAGFAPPGPMRAQGASVPMAVSVPIATGEETLRVRVTVGFDIAD
jgi:uncharacterized protein YggE